MTLLDVAVDAVEQHGAMQKPTELAALLAIVYDHQPEVVWEIGTATGGTLWALAVTLEIPAVLVSIDLPGGPFSGGATIMPEDLQRLVRDHCANLTIIHGDSRFVKLPTIQPDFVLLDGDHSFAGVRADWEIYAPLVKPGGLVVLHDIVKHPESSGVEVDQVWREISENEVTVEIIDPTHTTGLDKNQWGGIGVVFR